MLYGSGITHALLLETPYGLKIMVRGKFDRKRTRVNTLIFSLFVLVNFCLITYYISMAINTPAERMTALLAAVVIGAAFFGLVYVLIYPQFNQKILVNETITINESFVRVEKKGNDHFFQAQEYPLFQNDAFMIDKLGRDIAIVLTNGNTARRLEQFDFRIVPFSPMRYLCKGFPLREAENLIALIESRYPQYRIHSYQDDEDVLNEKEAE